MYIKTITYKTAVFIFCAATLLSCSGNTDKNEKPEEPAAPKEKTGVLSLTWQQMSAVGIDTGQIEQKNLTSVVKANGQLAVPPQNKADVSLLSGGIINHIHVIEGQQVHRGQILATINNQDLIKIEQDYLAARNNFVYIEAEYDRQGQLKAAGAGTGKSFQLSQATYNAERSKLLAYESQLAQLGISAKKISNGHIISAFPVRSPINGTVGQILANTGAFVQPGTTIMEVVDNSKIHCDLTVFEKDLMQVKVGQKVNFQLTNQDNQNITGNINGINKSFENESKGVIVHAVINNTRHNNLIPGMYVTALISTGNHLTAAVPVDAVVRAEGKQFIFIVIDKDKTASKTISFKKEEVNTGVTELGYIEIKPLRNWPAGVLIATKGAFYLQSKSSGGEEEE